jgi:hypothetical protein
VAKGGSRAQLGWLAASIVALTAGAGGALALSSTDDADSPATVTTTTTASPPTTTAAGKTDTPSSADPSDTGSSDAGLTLPAPAAETAQTILLGARQANGVRLGTLTLQLENKTGAPGKLVGQFLPDGQEKTVALGEGPAAPLRLLRPEASPIPVGEPISAVFEFELAASEAPSALDGLLVLSLEPLEGRPARRAARRAAGGGARDAKPVPFAVRVAGAIEPITGVSVQPAAVTMQATRFPPFGQQGDDVEVRLVGSGAVAFAVREPEFESSVLLRDDSGDSAVVKISELEPHDGYVDAQVTTDSKLHAGEYKGDLRLGEAADDPKLSLTLRAHHFFLYALAAVVLGAALGLLAPYATGIRRRKRILGSQLKSVLADYDRELANGAPDEPWDLSEQIGKSSYFEEELFAFPRRQGARGLWSELRWARTAAEVDQLTDWALELSTQVSWWLELREPVRALREESEHSVPKLGVSDWKDTEIYEDGLALRDEIAQVDPAALTESQARGLKLRVVNQTRWEGAVRGIWAELVELRKTKKLTAKRLTALRPKLSAITSPKVRESKRTPEQWRELLAGFRELDEEIVSLRPEPSAVLGFDLLLVDFDDVDFFSGEGTERYIDDFDFGLDRGRRARRSIRRGDATRSAQEILDDVKRADWLMTLFLGLVAALVYTLTIYDDTWGTATDYLSAILAGLATKVIADWTFLPLFQSLRPQPAADSGGETDAVPSALAGDAAVAPKEKLGS